MKKLITLALASVMLITNVLAASFASLTDLPSTIHWAYNNIKYVYENNVMTGTSATTFAPSRTMSRAEFITVMVRAMYPEADASSNGGNWYDGYVRVAIEKGLITSTKYSEAQLTQSMPRQEMAWMMMNYIEATESTAYDLVNTWQIADYDSIDNQYQSDVVKAYSLGLLSGTDKNGTFKPQGTMTRQEAAAVINRMMDASIRNPQGPEELPQADGAIIIYEGQIRDGRNAKAGDTFIKANGTSIILTVGPNGVVGEGQGVAPDLGVTWGQWGQVLQNQMQASCPGLGYTDSFGNTVNNEKYQVNQITGEGHWGREWMVIASTAPTAVGTFDGQLSADKNFYWSTNEWIRLSNVTLTDSGYSQILSLNGLK